MVINVDDQWRNTRERRLVSAYTLFGDPSTASACSKASKEGTMKAVRSIQGWRSGESARLPRTCSGFDSHTRCHKWAEFVGSLLCSVPPGSPVFPFPQKLTFDLS